MKKETIGLAEGAGGFESWQIFKEIRKILSFEKDWENLKDDGAVFDFKKRKIFNLKEKKLVFTTDGSNISPIFFPGGDIGKIAFLSCINDLAVMGADPLGISLAFFIEEGFPKKDFRKILKSINEISQKTKVPVVTGDTKVFERKRLDKIAIVCAGIGIAERIISDDQAKPGDYILVNGDLGEHSIVILAKRYKFKTKLKSDAKSIYPEIKEIRDYISTCKDLTRGGLKANIVELSQKSKVKIILEEENLPFKKEVLSFCEVLGIDPLSLASEGKFFVTLPKKNLEKVLNILKKFNKKARIIGRVEKGRGVFLKTKLGVLKKIEMPRGKIVPRIC